MHTADKQLVLAAAKGDQSALEQLVIRHLSAVYRFCYGYLHDRAGAEDATQETFVKVWRYLGRFDHKQSFKPWLFAIARNTCLDFLKKQRDLAFSDVGAVLGQENLELSLLDNQLTPEIIAENKLLGTMLDQEIKSLPAKYADVVVLRHGQGLSFQEIAAATHKPLNTVKSHYRRAIGKLKVRLRKIL